MAATANIPIQFINYSPGRAILRAATLHRQAADHERIDA
jgi:hypothetical protein